MADILPTLDDTSNIKDKALLSNGSSSASLDQPTKPTTMPVSRKIRLQQMLWHSLMEAKGEIVGVTKTNGDTYSGVLFAIEAADNTIEQPNNINTMENNQNNENNTNAAWKYIVLKYVQKMSDPNMNPSERIRAPFEEELKIPASDFAALSAINITDHTNSYRRSNRQAFNDASGAKLHRKQRELVRWEASGDHEELENEANLNDLHNGNYDQFKENKKFNIEATFDESVYTSNLDKTDPNYARNLKEAKLREQHIMAQVTDNKHVADDRAYYNSHTHNNIDKDQDEEDAYSRVLHDHEASLSKQSLKDSKKKNSYIAPHMRGKVSNNTQKNNKGRNKQHNNNNNNQHRAPMNKNKGNKVNNITNNNNNNNNVVNGGNNQNNSPNHNNPQQQQTQPQTQQQTQPQTQTQQTLANIQNQMLQANIAQAQAQAQAHFTPNNNAIFAGLPPHIAQIVQSVNPTQQTMQLTQQQLHVYQQLVLAQQNLSLAQQAQAQQATNNDTDTGITGNQAQDTEKEGDTQITGGVKDDGGSLNPHAMEFTPQISPLPIKQQTQTPQTQATTQPTQQLLTQQQQQQQALQAQLLQQTLGVGQYSFNPATGQYVLNPYAQQGQQQQFQLLQQQQHNAYIQQLALQQQLQLQQTQVTQQGDVNNNNNITNIATQQQALLAQHQQQLALQQQQALLAQQQVQAQAQANGLNIGAPLFTPTNIATQQQAQQAQPTNAQQLVLQQQAQQQQQQQAQQAILQHQQLQQQYLSFGTVVPQQQQFYMQNMQNLMQQ